MSREDQGRQWHGWFGTGTGSDGVDKAPGRDVVGAVIDAALTALPGGRRGGVAAGLRDGGAADLRAALPIWVGSAGMEAGEFRSLLVGPGFGTAGAASLQAMARAVGEGGVAAAGEHLASALGGVGGEGVPYALNYARDMADYAVAEGAVPDGDALHSHSDAQNFTLNSEKTDIGGIVSNIGHSSPNMQEVEHPAATKSPN